MFPRLILDLCAISASDALGRYDMVVRPSFVKPRMSRVVRPLPLW